MKTSTFKIENGTSAARFIWTLKRTLEKQIAYNLPESLIIQSNGKEGKTMGFTVKPIIGGRLLAERYTKGDTTLVIHKKATFDSLGITLDLQKLCKNPETAMLPVHKAFIKIWADSKSDADTVYNAGPQQPKNPMGKEYTTCDVPGELAKSARYIAKAEGEGEALPKGKGTGTKIKKLTAADKRLHAALLKI